MSKSDTTTGIRAKLCIGCGDNRAQADKELCTHCERDMYAGGFGNPSQFL